MSNPNDPLRGRRTCPYCNTEIIEGSKFCIGCGRPIDQPDITSHNQVANSLCPYCGRALRGNETFCNYCGNHLNKTEIDESQQRARRSQSSNQYRNDRVPPRIREPRRDLNSDGYQINYLLIILFFLVIFTVFINGFIAFFLVDVSAIAVYYDAKNIINVQKREKSFASNSWSPLSWGLMTLLLWIIGHPLYLIKRRSIWEDNQVITDRYEQNKSNGSIATLLAVVIILDVLFIIFSPVLTINTGLSTPYSNTQSTLPIQNTQQVQNYYDMNIGESAQSSEEKVTLNDVSRQKYYLLSYGGYSSSMTADPGKEFIFCDIDIQNIGDSSGYLSAGSFSLEDSAGYRLEPYLYTGDDALSLFAELYPGQKTRGIVAFQVPEGSQGYKLYYDLSGGLFGTNILASWIV